MTVVLSSGCLKDLPEPLGEPEGGDKPSSETPSGDGHPFTGDSTADENRSYVELLPTGHRGRAGEPTIAVLSDGTMFTNAWDETLRSIDGGRSWETVLDVSTGDMQAISYSGDPWIWADPVTDRVFSMHAFACTAFWWSDDRGETWTENRIGCITPINDHPQLSSGPPGPGPNPLAGTAFPSVLYQCFNEYSAYFFELPIGTIDEEVAACLMSYDGGQTWPVERVLAAHVTGARGCGHLHSPAAVSAEGVVAVAVGTPGCQGLDIQVSRDSGLTWEPVPGPRGPNASLGTQPTEPYLAWGQDGTLYLLWRGPDNLRHLARADQLDGSWSDAWTVTAPGVTSTEYGALVAGSSGRVALAYLGTRDSSAVPSQVASDTRWHLFLATADDAGSAAPTFVHHQATPEQDPVQIGCTRTALLETNDPGPDGECENLRDFIGGATTPDGTFLVSFTDGCPPGCDTTGKSTDTHTVVAALRDWSLQSART